MCIFIDFKKGSMVFWHCEIIWNHDAHLRHIYLPGADPRFDKNTCSWDQKPNTPPSRSQSYPKLYHMIFFLSSIQCNWASGCSTLTPHWDFSPLSFPTKDLAVCSLRFLPVFVSSNISHLSEAHSSPLTPSGVRQLLHGRVTWTSQI